MRLVWGEIGRKGTFLSTSTAQKLTSRTRSNCVKGPRRTRHWSSNSCHLMRQSICFSFDLLPYLFKSLPIHKEPNKSFSFQHEYRTKRLKSTISTTRGKKFEIIVNRKRVHFEMFTFYLSLDIQAYSQRIERKERKEKETKREILKSSDF